MQQRSAFFLTVFLTHCTVNLTIPDQAVIECGSAADCPDGKICVDGLSRCVSPGTVCILGRDEIYVVAPDGTSCGDADAICLDATCVRSTCGDGFVDVVRGEACDEGAANGDDGASPCRTSCELPRCGDGITDLDEACDDGNPSDADACLTTCVVARCGDGFVDATREACDDSNEDNADACLTTCALNNCGDGFRNAALEQCDDGNVSDQDACVTGCVPAACGDGYIQTGVEVCDDGNTSSVDACRADCKKIQVCGDGELDAMETCDDGDGDTNPNDGCAACRRTIWDASVVTGVGAAAGDPQALNITAVAAAATDSSGTTFIAGRTQVWRIDATGQLISYVGSKVACTGPMDACGNNGPAALALLGNVEDLAVDPFGNLYISDSITASVRRVDRATGAITLYAGSSQVCVLSTDPCGDLGPANQAQLISPMGITFDRNGNLYIADRDMHRVRRVNYGSRTIQTVVGNGDLCATPLCNDGPAATASFYGPEDVAVSSTGVLYIADNLAHQLRRSDGINVSTVAGDGTPCPESPTGVCGNDLPSGATGATLNGPRWVEMIDDDVLFFAEIGNNRIRRLTLSTATLSNHVGIGQVCTGLASNCGDGGPVSTARITLEFGTGGFHVTKDGRVLIADSGTDSVREVDAAATSIHAIAGVGFQAKDDPGNLSAIAFDASASIASFAIGGDGAIWFSSPTLRRILRVDPLSGIMSVAGGYGLSCGLPYTTCGDGAPAPSGLMNPGAIAISPLGELYFADMGNRMVRKIALDGTLRYVSGSTFGAGCTGAAACGDGGGPSGATYGSISALTFDSTGNLYIADTATFRIRRIDSLFTTVSTVAGSGTFCGSGACGDDTAAVSAQLGTPRGIAVDLDNTLLVADATQRRVRRVTIGGNISAFAGTGATCSPSTDLCGDGGAPLAAQFAGPVDVHVAPGGAVYISDANARRLRKVEGGMVSTAAGSGSACAVGSCGDLGLATDARFGAVGAARSESATQIVVLDTTLSTLRRVTLSTNAIVTLAGPIDLPGDGLLSDASLKQPRAVLSLAPNEWLLSADSGPAGRIKRVRLGATQRLDTVIGYPGLMTSSGNARFSRLLIDPGALVLDANGVGNGGVATLYVAESGRHLIYRVSMVTPSDQSTWTIAPWAGTEGLAGETDGQIASATFSRPTGLAFDSTSGTLYVSDRDAHTIRAIDVATSQVATVAGIAYFAGYFGEQVDGVDAVFDGPQGLAVDPGRALYVADTNNHRVRRISLETMSHTVTTLLGDGVPTSSGEGFPSRTFSIDSPRGLARDSSGNLWAAGGHAVRLLVADAQGIVDGSGHVLTLYGRAPRSTFPANVSNCLAGIAIDSTDARALVSDECLGLLVELDRTIE